MKKRGMSLKIIRIFRITKGSSDPEFEKKIIRFSLKCGQDISPGAGKEDYQIFLLVSPFIIYFTSRKITRATITKSMIAPT